MTAALAAVPAEFSVTVTGDRAEAWLRILGMAEIPVLSPTCVTAEIPDYGVCRVYLVDLKALSGEQHARLAMYLADRFKKPIQDVVDDMNSRGVPVVAEGCILAVRSTRWFV